MKKLSGLVLMMLGCQWLQAGDSTNIYMAEAVPKLLKENANTVVRFHRTEMEVSGPDRATLRTREVLTILNSKGSDELIFTCYTDKFRQLEDADLKLYDASGKLVERHRKKDLNSTAAGSGLVEDGVLYYYRLSAASYPVTVEKEYVTRLRGIYELPSFYFSQPYQSVEYSTFLLKHPASLTVNHKVYNLQAQPKKIVAGTDEILQWEASSIGSLVHESNSGDWRYNVPSISFNMTNFVYDGYAGDMSSWRNLGLWYNYIVGSTNRLSPKYQDEIRSLVAGVSDDREKVRILYQNLQKNFRYVSIQLGIGGLKPFPADFVHEKKYGDCKGLSNYMEACLAAVGIKSHEVWVNSGKNDVNLDPEFTTHDFDHQILLVPMGKDSIWLECTSNYNDFAHLGSFTENRYVLVMTDQGGKLARTPKGQPSANTLHVSTTVKLNEEGNAEVSATMSSTGEFKYLMINLDRIPEDRQKTYFLDHFGMNQPDEMKIRFADAGASYTTTTEIFAEKGYEFKAGTKHFLRPRVFKVWTEKLGDTEDRKFDYFMEFPFIATDTTVYEIPEGFTVESLPKNKSIQFSLGSYESKYWYEADKKKVYSFCSLKVQDSRIPASLFKEAKKFYDGILEDGNQKLILIRNN